MYSPMQDDEERRDRVAARLHAHTTTQRAWSSAGLRAELRHETLHISAPPAGPLEVPLQEITSLQLSRYERVRPRHWLQRLVGARSQTEDLVNVKLRSARTEHLSLCAVCSDTALLNGLPWMEVSAQLLHLSAFATTLTTALELQGRLRLGPVTPRPEHLTRSRPETRRQHQLLDRAAETPTGDAWKTLCAALVRCHNDELRPILPWLQASLAVWRDALRAAPPHWGIDIASGEDNPRLQLARTLNLSARVSMGGAQRLVTSHHASHLTSLHLSNNALFSKLAQDLANSPHMTHLELLNLSKNLLDATAVHALAHSNNLSSLHALYLSFNPLGPQGLLAIAQSDSLPRLSLLDLAQTRTDDSALAALAHTTQLSELRNLYLARNPITDEGAAALAQWPGLAQLEVLDLSDCGIRDDGARALAASPHAVSLGSLMLTGSRVSEDTRTALTRALRRTSVVW